MPNPAILAQGDIADTIAEGTREKDAILKNLARGLRHKYISIDNTLSFFFFLVGGCILFCIFVYSKHYFVVFAVFDLLRLFL